VSALQALSIGPAVDVEAAVPGRVHSVFSRAVNIEIGSDLWTLVAAPGTDLPFGIVVAAQDFQATGLRNAQPVHVRAGFVGVGGGGARVVVDCRAALRWRPVFDVAPVPGLAERLHAIAAAADARAWKDSARMAQAVVRALHDSSALTDVLGALVGCGPGTTPAGDDVLVGVLAVLVSPYAGPSGAAAAARLRRLLVPLLPATTDISAHLLRQAMDGRFSRRVHELMCALVADPGHARLARTVEGVVATGATSGADLCMGLIASAPAFLAAYHERAAA
jgi:hypothetical protein